MDIIKNPVIIGLFFATVTYVYLYRSVNDKKKSKKHHKKEEINLLIPLIVGLIVWFMSFAYFQNDNTEGMTGLEKLFYMLSIIAVCKQTSSRHARLLLEPFETTSAKQVPRSHKINCSLPASLNFSAMLST